MGSDEVLMELGGGLEGGIGRDFPFARAGTMSNARVAFGSRVVRVGKTP